MGHVGAGAPTRPARGGRTGEDARAYIERFAAVTWRFNAWAKYPNYKNDEKISSLMTKAAGAQELRPMFGKRQVVLEGGSIDSNGKGTLLTTEECLLSKFQQRNAGMKHEEHERVFPEYLGT